MTEKMNQNMETVEQVDTNKQTLVNNTKQKLSEVMKQVGKVPESLKEFAENMRKNTNPKTVLLTAIIFSLGSGLVNASQSGQDILDQAISSGDSEGFVVQMFENKDYEELKQLASILGLDPNLIRDCQQYENLLDEMNCNADKTDKKNKMIIGVSLERQERLRAEREQSLERQERLRAEREQLKAEEEQLKAEEEQLKAEEEQLKAEEEQLRVINNNLEIITNFLDGTGEINQEVYEAANFIAQRPGNFDPRIINLANQIIQNY